MKDLIGPKIIILINFVSMNIFSFVLLKEFNYVLLSVIIDIFSLYYLYIVRKHSIRIPILVFLIYIVLCIIKIL